MEFTSTSISTVHDARVAPANHFRPPGGLTPEELRYAVGLVTTRITVLAAGITVYDPDVDPDGVQDAHAPFPRFRQAKNR